jgi:hypothetical protein
MSKWKRTCEAAKNDPVLVGIATSIVAANRAGNPDRAAYAAFTDRVKERDLFVPNRAYYTLLIGSCLSLYRA